MTTLNIWMGERRLDIQISNEDPIKTPQHVFQAAD